MKRLAFLIIISFLVLNCSTQLKQNTTKGVSVTNVEVQPYVGGREGNKGKVYRIYTTSVADEVVLNRLYIDNQWQDVVQDQTDENLFLAYSKEVVRSKEESTDFKTIGEEERALDITIVKPDYKVEDYLKNKVVLEFTKNGKVKQVEITNIDKVETAFYP